MIADAYAGDAPDTVHYSGMDTVGLRRMRLRAIAIELHLLGNAMRVYGGPQEARLGDELVDLGATLGNFRDDTPGAE